MTKIENPVQPEIRQVLAEAGWFQTGGVWAVVDGQFGSTGKGLASSVLAELFADYVDIVTSNAGPNSGHTSYVGDEKVVLQQLPTFSVVAHKLYGNVQILTHLNAGAIIDVDRFNNEVAAHNLSEVYVDPHAAFVGPEHKIEETGLISAIGSTGKGTGAALAAKVLRNPSAVVEYPSNRAQIDPLVHVIGLALEPNEVAFMEISQGFSLSLNASGMYPYTTSRDCTIAQGLSDAGIHPSLFRDCMMVVRTFPIRVAGNSGPGYDDQVELSWADLGVEPEITTVTKKVRRVFTWSDAQFRHALLANRPGVVFVNFMNYLPEGVDHDVWVHDNILLPYTETMGDVPDAILLGYGPKNSDVKLWTMK